MPVVVLVGSLDTKGDEYRFARDRLGTLHVLVNNAAILDVTGIDRLTLGSSALSVQLTPGGSGQGIEVPRLCRSHAPPRSRTDRG